MYLISELKRILNQTFKFHKPRVDCLAKFLLGLFSVRTVNLSEIAVAFQGKAQKASRYTRLHRFLKQVNFDSLQVARFIFNLFPLKGQKVYLTLDRTNWYWGKQKLNVLVLGIAYEGVAIPLFWTWLPKGGNASGQEHSTMIQRFLQCFDSSIIAGVLADREFANQDFFKYLSDHQIPFYIRIKEGALVSHFKHSKPFKAKQLFKGLDLNEQQYQQQPVTVHGQQCCLAAGRSPKGELLIVATNQSPHNAVSIYLRRWEIENLFATLKSKGFRFEETHVTKLPRLNTFMNILAIGFAWMHRIGEWAAEIKPIQWKTYRNKKRYLQSTFFRYGLDYFRELLLQFKPAKTLLRQCLRLLNIPPQIPIGVSS